MDILKWIISLIFNKNKNKIKGGIEDNKKLKKEIEQIKKGLKIK